jgi:hypothetical protein
VPEALADNALRIVGISAYGAPSYAGLDVGLSYDGTTGDYIVNVPGAPVSTVGIALPNLTLADLIVFSSRALDGAQRIVVWGGPIGAVAGTHDVSAADAPTASDPYDYSALTVSYAEPGGVPLGVKGDVTWAVVAGSLADNPFGVPLPGA